MGLDGDSGNSEMSKTEQMGIANGKAGRKTYQEVRVGSGDWKWNDTGSYKWGAQE